MILGRFNRDFFFRSGFGYGVGLEGSWIGQGSFNDGNWGESQVIFSILGRRLFVFMVEWVFGFSFIGRVGVVVVVGVGSFFCFQTQLEGVGSSWRSVVGFLDLSRGFYFFRKEFCSKDYQDRVRCRIYVRGYRCWIRGFVFQIFGRVFVLVQSCSLGSVLVVGFGRGFWLFVYYVCVFQCSGRQVRYCGIVLYVDFSISFGS